MRSFRLTLGGWLEYRHRTLLRISLLGRTREWYFGLLPPWEQ